MLRQGYITRYLCERLAFGLAPESIKAFFVQRQRWARGAIQMLFLAEGPFGPRLSMMHRLLFLPTHWLTQSMQCIMSVVAPLVFLWTGIPPLVNVTVATGLFYLVPMVIAIVGGTAVFGQQKYFPLAAQVLGLFQSLKIFPTAISTLVRPHGHIFKVTPKGADAGGDGYEAGIFWAASVLLLLTFLGLLVNASPDWRIVQQPALIPLVAMWCGINIVLLFLVCMLCLQAPIHRGEERFSIAEPVWLQNGRGTRTLARTVDLSLAGVGLTLAASPPEPYAIGDSVRLHIKDVGYVPGHVARVRDDNVGIEFELPACVERDLLIRKLFTSGLDTTNVTTSVLRVTMGMLKRIWMVNSLSRPAVAAGTPGPKEEKLPAQTLVVPPLTSPARLSALASERATEAA
jgi:cellulose synthase (UDP-forming)